MVKKTKKKETGVKPLPGLRAEKIKNGNSVMTKPDKRPVSLPNFLDTWKLKKTKDRENRIALNNKIPPSWRPPITNGIKKR